MSQLHQELHELLNKNHEYVPNTLLFRFLNDSSEVNLVSNSLFSYFQFYWKISISGFKYQPSRTR